MTNTTTTPTADEKIRTLITTGLGHLGSNTLHEILTEGDELAGVEPLDGDARDVADDWLHNDWSDDRTARVWSNHDGILHRLERLALHAADSAVSQATEQGGLGNYLKTVADEAHDLPSWLSARFIQQEIDRLEAGMFDTTKEWQRLIGLLQIEREGNYFTGGRNDTDNHDDRKRAWDELLKFTKYHVKVTYTTPSGGKTSLTVENWAQSLPTVHNQAVRLIPDDGEYERADEGPVERFQPGQVQDPLPDLEGFVFYEGRP
jgi:hypothetical protein